MAVVSGGVMGYVGTARAECGEGGEVPIKLRPGEQVCLAQDASGGVRLEGSDAPTFPGYELVLVWVDRGWDADLTIVTEEGEQRWPIVPTPHKRVEGEETIKIKGVLTSWRVVPDQGRLCHVQIQQGLQLGLVAMKDNQETNRVKVTATGE